MPLTRCGADTRSNENLKLPVEFNLYRGLVKFLTQIASEVNFTRISADFLTQTLSEFNFKRGSTDYLSQMQSESLIFTGESFIMFAREKTCRWDAPFYRFYNA